MAMRTYGTIEYKDVNVSRWSFEEKIEKKWVIEELEPHARIKLKAIFKSIGATQQPPFLFNNTPEICTDLNWFMQRYPLKINNEDKALMEDGNKFFIDEINDLEKILSPDYKPHDVKLKDGKEGRDYQIKANEVFMVKKRMLLGDELGLGKTVTAILALLEQGTLPAFVVVQAHLVNHWMEKIKEFTNLTVHPVKGRKPYNLPPADVYVMKYTCMGGWTDTFDEIKYKTVIFDEVQELRRKESQKWEASKLLADGSEYVLGLSATPIYNYGEEIFNIMQVLKPDCLGSKYEFQTEWTKGYGNRQISDPKALGTYLRENFIMLRRTREEVGRELPVINTIVHTVDYDEAEVKKSEELAKSLAMKVISGSFVERGQAARDLDMLARKVTGVSKARYVAQYVKFLLEAGEPVVLAGWHRSVYDIWLEELKEYNPVLYTGTEAPAKKQKSKEAFVNGETDLFIISLRSGIGLDGLQYRCKTVVIGELDWSPQIHNQLIGRVDRDGQQHQVTAIYLISNEGSDLPIVELLGIKSSQAHNIIDPLKDVKAKDSDVSRMKVLAQHYLDKNK